MEGWRMWIGFVWCRLETIGLCFLELNHLFMDSMALEV